MELTQARAVASGTGTSQHLVAGNILSQISAGKIHSSEDLNFVSIFVKLSGSMRRTEGKDAAKAWRRWLLFCSIGYAPKQRSEAACRLPSQSAPYSRFHVGVLASELRKVTDTRGPLQSSKFSRSGFAICLFVSPFSGGLLPLALRMQAYDKSSNKGYINFGGARDHLHLVKCPACTTAKV